MTNNTIQEYENILRSLIIIILTEKYNEEYENHYRISPERLNKWKEKRDIETKKYGITREERLIYYSDIFDLKTIIDKNWDLFQLIFKSKKRFEVFFEELEKFRNSLAHGRELLTYQHNLIDGIIGDLKTQLVIYRSKNEKVNDYYIQILKISDNYGNTWNHTDRLASIGLVTDLLVRVGDSLEFIVDAYDPKGRTIKYFLSVGGFESNRQESNVLVLKVTESMVRRRVLIQIFALVESDYQNNDFVEFVYSALP